MGVFAKKHEEMKIKLLGVITFAFLATCGTAAARQLEPVVRTVGRLNISIDPRMELLSAVQLSAKDYPVIDRDLEYSREVMEYFAPLAGHKAPLMTGLMLKHVAFGHDAPVTFMLHLSQPVRLKRVIPYTDRLIQRAGNEKTLTEYRRALKKFARKGDFDKFWTSRQVLYNEILDRSVAELRGSDFVGTLEDYLGMKQGSYNIIIAPSFDGGYGPRIQREDGLFDLYCCLSTTDEADGVPYLSFTWWIYFTWHEFGHSFVNPLTDLHIDRVMETEGLFDALKGLQLPYGSWPTYVNEHIIRAIVVRLIALHVNDQAAQNMLDNERRQGMVYVEPLIEKLKEYESRRAETGITFDKFYPELLDVFGGLLKEKITD